MAKLSWKQAFINAVDAYRNAKGTTDKIAVGNFPALLEEAIVNSGGDEGISGIIYNEIDADGNLVSATVHNDKVFGYTFYNHDKLVTVDMPEINEIGRYAFYYCSNLALTELPTGVTSIGPNAFYGCKNLALTELPIGITSIENSAFYGCTNLALTELPTRLTSIGSSAFYNCSKISFTELPASITSIGSSAFYTCTGLTELTFKGTPTSISSSAFIGCYRITTINVPWAEGEVANAPWGATNATINYNYTGE